MNNSRVSIWFRALLVACLALLGVITLANDALAFGTIRLKRSTIEEVDGRWKFDMEVDYGSKPHLGHIPFDFIFELKTYYEYSITDTDKEPVVRPKPMHNQQPQREQIDLAFADARGDVWRQTKFSFHLRRDRGFSAGEYMLTVKRSSDGATLGRPMRVTLEGKNELIDRRSIVFTGETKNTKKQPAEGAQEPKAGEKEGSANDEAPGTPEQDEATNPSTNEPTAEEGSEEDIDTPQTIEERPGGCGCRTTASHGPGMLGAGALLGIGLLVVLRRRRLV